MRLVNALVVAATAALALAACASVDKAVEDVRNLANHQQEEVTYPNLADIPDKPTRPETTEQHSATVHSLEADREANAARADQLREQASKMRPLPSQPGQQPGQPSTQAQTKP